MAKANNCRRLADMLEHRVKDEQFNMRHFTKNCGTIGCALGLAALSGEFRDQGLGWHPVRKTVGMNCIPETMAAFNKGKAEAMPTLHGCIVYWEEAGEEVFGEKAFNSVLLCTNPRSRQQVANELREVADRMEA